MTSETVLDCGWAWWPYIRHVLTQLGIGFRAHEEHDHWLHISRNDISTVMALFPWDRDYAAPALQFHPFVKFNRKVCREFAAVDGPKYTGIFCHVAVNMKPLVLGYLQSLGVHTRATVHKVPDEYQQVFIFVESPVASRFALAKDLLDHFEEQIAATLKDRWTDDCFRLYGSSIVDVILGKVSPKDLAFEIHKVRPKRNVNLKFPWRKRFRSFLEKVNRCANENEIFHKVFNFLENDMEFDWKPGYGGGPRAETLRQQHSRLMYTVLENITNAVPQTRKEHGAPEPQMLAECVVDRPGQITFANLNSDDLTFTYGSYASSRESHRVGGSKMKKTLAELIAIKKELDWWEGCNRRVFVNKSGKFFRDDKRLKLWKAMYKKRNIESAPKNPTPPVARLVI